MSTPFVNRHGKLSIMNEKRLSVYIEKSLAALFLLTFLILILYPVGDPDVFWHLKTGEWIWQQKELPDRDPFSFSVDSGIYKDQPRTNAILKGYWLSQLLIYGSYNLFGLYGIILFRCIVYLGLMSILYVWMRRKGVNQITTFFFLIPAFLTVYHYGGERPNTISYLLAVALFYILNECVRDKNKKALLLPVLMWFWSMLHGGFLLGEVIIGSYLLATLYRILKGTASYNVESFRIAILVISMAAPLLNTAALGAAAQMLDIRGSLYARSIAENTGPYTHFKIGDYSPAVMMIFAVLFIAIVIRKFSLEYILIFLFTLTLSISAIRYIPLFILLMTPPAAAAWGDRPTFKNFYEAENRSFRYLMYAVLLFSTFFIGQAAYRGSVLLKGPLSEAYPEDAVQFIKKEKPVGRIFNEYGWGGYLIQRLYPEKKVFIDGRGLSLAVFEKYDDVMTGSLKTTDDGRPLWKFVLDEYKIQIVLVPICNKLSNRMAMIGKRLMNDPEWSAVFVSDKDNIVFLKKQSARNQELIRTYGISKLVVYEKALKLIAEEHGQRGKWRGDLECGLINVYLGKYDKAALYFDKAIEKNANLKSTAVYKGLERIRSRELPVFNDNELEEIQNL